MSHSAAGPRRNTTRTADDAERDTENKQDQQIRDQHGSVEKERQPENRVASSSITIRPHEAAGDAGEHQTSRHIRRSSSGVAKIFRKLRDQTSSKNAVVTPCITRMKKSHSSTAPSSAGTKLKPDRADRVQVLRDEAPQHDVDRHPGEHRQHARGAAAQQVKLPQHDGGEVAERAIVHALQR